MTATKAQLLEEIENLKNQIARCNRMTRWYNNLRKKEIVVLDGEARYLTGDDLDEYCKSITPIVMTRNELLKELLPGLNELFDKTYQEAFYDTRSQS